MADSPRDPTTLTRGSTRPPGLLVNWLSLAGLFLLLGGVTSFVVIYALELLADQPRAYPGVTTVPSLGVALLGAFLAGLGALREWNRRRRGRGPSLTGVVAADLGRLARANLGRVVVFGSVGLTLGFLLLSAAGYRAYEFTSSNTFCGEACHSVMHPEWITFNTSPHAQAKCVDCHVGPGAESFVASKLNGMRQLVSYAKGTYRRPIPTPIHNLRPAREICEQCHWSGQFFGYREETKTYFLANEENTPVRVRMLTKIGGGSRGFLKGSGIHYHMVTAARVEYIARDVRRQQIPWVRVTHRDGSTHVYEDSDDPLSDEERESFSVRTMTCIDCHSRPAHRFLPPNQAINDAMSAGHISRALPYIKVQSVKALAGKYESTEEALAGIAQHLQEYYEDEYPELVAGKNGDLEHAIEVIQAIYRSTIFPRMKADWFAHPDDSGHLNFNGCFRCHNDAMESADGEGITTDCNACHVILAQGESIEEVETRLPAGEEFVHPEYGETFDEFTWCTDCHTGGGEVYE